MISFIIPQKGRIDLLEATLRSIAQQKWNRPLGSAPVSVEVVLITQDENPQDACALLERLFGEIEYMDYKCLVATNEDTTISCLRNRAARASSGELLAFLDADIALSRYWVDSMMEELMANEARVLVSAAQALSANPSMIENIQVELNRLRVDSVVSALSGHNLLLRRETFEAVGGFPEHLMTCEDSVFTDKVGKLGDLYRSSKASYVHLGEDRDLKEVFRKEKWRSYSNFSTLYGREVRLVELISLVAPIIVILCGLIAVISALMGESILALSFAFMALLPVLSYTLRLLLQANWRLRFSSIFMYYSTYFVARGIGMVHGLGSALKVRDTLKETV